MELLQREKGYIVQCLCVLMSYKECLGCALQEGALDVILSVRLASFFVCWSGFRVVIANES